MPERGAVRQSPQHQQQGRRGQQQRSTGTVSPDGCTRDTTARVLEENPWWRVCVGAGPGGPEERETHAVQARGKQGDDDGDGDDGDDVEEGVGVGGGARDRRTTTTSARDTAHAQVSTLSTHAHALTHTHTTTRENTTRESSLVTTRSNRSSKQRDERDERDTSEREQARAVCGVGRQRW